MADKFKLFCQIRPRPDYVDAIVSLESEINQWLEDQEEIYRIVHIEQYQLDVHVIQSREGHSEDFAITATIFYAAGTHL